jgi:N utilization substance protein B
MAARSKARKRALDVLFEADIRGADALDVLEVHEGDASSPFNPYVRVLVEGVTARRGAIDDVLATYSVDWPLERMPAVDRSVLRIGAWELLWGEIPVAVAVSEAVALAQALSTDESPAFVNGLLGRVAEVKPYLVLD